MSFFSNLIIPLIICSIIVFGLVKNVDVFDTFVYGAKKGLFVGIKIIPPLVALMTGVGMFKASGALDIITSNLSGPASLINIPQEVIPLAILRPISGSGALVIFQDILTTHGPDSFVGRVASVMQGSTETTFYTIAVYYGATKITKTRHTLPCALTADLTGFIFSALAVNIFFYM